MPVVHRWRRYGYDRAYVEIDGLSIGYRDLATGRVRAYDPANVAAIEDATSDVSGIADIAEVTDGSVTEPESPRAAGRHAYGSASDDASDADNEDADRVRYVPRHAASDRFAHRGQPTTWPRRKRAS